MPRITNESASDEPSYSINQAPAVANGGRFALTVYCENAGLFAAFCRSIFGRSFHVTRRD
jgi:hypothetical protein